ncbi:MAG: hypothetical protein K0U78_05090 [Actinomycetia bacterium]|nr:hypothetical protein [Actinomycetes bacterium]
MAYWKNIQERTSHEGLFADADIDKDSVKYEVKQEMDPFLAQAKFDRDHASMQNGHTKKFATIPDLVSIEILNKYGINLHDPATLGDRDKMKKFKYIIQTEYKHLMAY